jgi:hypothetical protein
MDANTKLSAVCVVSAVGLVVFPACSRDVRLAGKEIPTVTVQPVTHYGITLDDDATPEQVAFVALQAIREDFLAEDEAARHEALDVQFSIAAANEIQARNRTSMSRDEFVYNVVYRWTPTVAYYVDDFPTDWESAEPRLHRRSVTMLSSKAEAEDAEDRCEVAMEVADPGGNPDAEVVLLVWLAKDKGLWRVTHLGFDPRARSIEARR